MSAQKYLSGPLFDRDVEVPIARLPRVRAAAEVQDVLQREKLAPHRGSCMVVSICYLINDGAVEDVSLSVVSGMARNKIAIAANQVFPDAPDGWKLVLNRDYPQFLFPPNRTQSQWVQASRLGLKFYTHYVVGGDAVNQVVCTNTERTEKNMSDFQVRLAIEPSEDPKLAKASLVALPVTTAAMPSLLSPELAQDGVGYPVVLLSVEPLMTVGPRPHDQANSEHFGSPCLPILRTSAGAAEPESIDVLTSVLALWGTATTPRLVSAEEFEQATAVVPVQAGVVPAEWRWPCVINENIQDDAAGESKKFKDVFFSSTLSGAWCLNQTQLVSQDR